MARRKGPAPEDLVGPPEIAQRLEVTTHAVHKWKQRYDDFPEPYVILSVGPIYYWPDVQAWYDTSGPRAYTTSG